MNPHHPCERSSESQHPARHLGNIALMLYSLQQPVSGILNFGGSWLKDNDADDEHIPTWKGRSLSLLLQCHQKIIHTGGLHVLPVPCMVFRDCTTLLLMPSCPTCQLHVSRLISHSLELDLGSHPSERISGRIKRLLVG